MRIVLVLAALLFLAGCSAVGTIPVDKNVRVSVGIHHGYHYFPHYYPVRRGYYVHPPVVVHRHRHYHRHCHRRRCR